MTLEGNETTHGELGHLLDGANGAATQATLASIVARSRRHRERRLKLITGVSIVIALAGASVAGISSATRSTPSVSTNDLARSGRNATTSANPTWTKQHRTLGNAPTGLTWSTHPATGTSPGASASSNAANPSSGAALCTVDSCGVPYPIGVVGPLTKLFARTSGDVMVRAFTETMHGVMPYSGVSSGSALTASPPASSSSPATMGGTPDQTAPIFTSCESSRALVVEVSNPGAVGSTTVSLPSISISQPGQPFEVIDSSAVGVAEASPIEVLTVHVASNVSTVQANFADGSSDQMSTVGGWAVLVDDGSAPVPATIKALDSSGTVIATATVNDDDAIAQPERCLAPIEPQPLSGSGTATPSTGSK